MPFIHLNFGAVSALFKKYLSLVHRDINVLYIIILYYVLKNYFLASKNYFLDYYYLICIQNSSFLSEFRRFSSYYDWHWRFTAIFHSFLSLVVRIHSNLEMQMLAISPSRWRPCHRSLQAPWLPARKSICCFVVGRHV